jgi:hypothetical protein
LPNTIKPLNKNWCPFVIFISIFFFRGMSYKMKKKLYSENNWKTHERCDLILNNIIKCSHRSVMRIGDQTSTTPFQWEFQIHELFDKKDQSSTAPNLLTKLKKKHIVLVLWSGTTSYQRMRRSEPVVCDPNHQNFREIKKRKKRIKSIRQKSFQKQIIQKNTSEWEH